MAVLAEKARRVSRGDYLGPIELPQRDEIGQLASEMNHMCSELLSAEARLAKETTARESAQEALRHADRLTTVGLLAAGIAHELGTPLNVVSMRARMISTGEVTGDDVKRGAEIIHEEAGAMTRIIRQLLAFARRSPPSMSRVELRAMAEQALSMLAPLAEKKGCTLEVAPGEAIEFDGDHHRLTQVLTNLVINSVQAMPKGGAVRVSATKTRVVPPPYVGGAEATFARLDVRDEGEGIAPDVLPRLFEPFFTTKPVGDGTALGLSVAWGILRDHHGWIEVASTPGAGTTFSLFIPLERPPT
jgi:signal transduction histidine kinase